MGKPKVNKQKAFLAAFRESGNITLAAEIVGIDRRYHYNWLKDAEYAEAFEEAVEHAADRLEQEARRRAVEGVAKPVWYKGEQCGVVQEYSDLLLIFLLKGVRPEKYKDRVNQEITGRHGGPIEVRTKYAQCSDEELDRLLAAKIGEIIPE